MSAAVVAAGDVAPSKAGVDGQSSAWAALAFPAVLIVIGALVIPVLVMVLLSFVDGTGAISLNNYRLLLSDPSLPTVVGTTVSIAFWCTLICVLLGTPVAYLLSELPQKIAGLLLIAVLLPFWTSLLVRTYAMLLLLQRRGLVNETLQSIGLTTEPLQLAHNATGTVIAMTQIMLPYFILPLYVSFRRIDRGMMNAAAGLGATPIRVFWTITLPQAHSGLLAGGFLVFVLCFGFYVTPAILGGGRVIMMAQAINTYLGLYPNWGAAGALATVLFLCTLLTLSFMRLCMIYFVPKRTTSRA